MRGACVVAGVAVVAFALCAGTTALAQASNYGIELNGTYRVISNGDWAKTNDVFIDEKTVIQTWTVNSSCVNPVECSGEVTSDQGWTAPLQYVNTRWILKREIPNWEPCPDGSAAPGSQIFIFWGVGPGGVGDIRNTDLLAGWDETNGPSGACGINKQLVIRLPIRVERMA